MNRGIHSGAAPAKMAAAACANLAAQDAQMSCRRTLQPQQQARERCLSAAITAENCIALPRGNIERYAADPAVWGILADQRVGFYAIHQPQTK